MVSFAGTRRPAVPPGLPNLPEGASTVGVQGQGVLITVTVSAQQGSQTIVRQPIVRGLSTDLTAQVVPETVEINPGYPS